MTDAARVIALAEPDFVTAEDGFVVWWPTKVGGFHEAWSLRAIADELDRRNADWAAQIEAYFSGQGQAA